jgi:hypothetical protein
MLPPPLLLLLLLSVICMFSYKQSISPVSPQLPRTATAQLLCCQEDA